MIKFSVTFAFTLIILFSQHAFAYDFGPGTIDIPDGFQALDIKNVRDQGTIHEFAKQHTNSQLNTSIKVTVYDFGQKLKPVPDGMLLAATESHLLNYLAGMRRHYGEYVYKKMKSISIDNTPAAHVEWSGKLSGNKMHGTVYSLIRGSHVVMLDARDYEGMPYDNLIAAIQAMSAVTLND